MISLEVEFEKKVTSLKSYLVKRAQFVVCILCWNNFRSPGTVLDEWEWAQRGQGLLVPVRQIYHCSCTIHMDVIRKYISLAKIYSGGKFSFTWYWLSVIKMQPKWTSYIVYHWSHIIIRKIEAKKSVLTETILIYISATLKSIELNIERNITKM